MIVVHSVTRGWQDIGILLRVMGARQPPIPCPTEGCLVTSCLLSYRHFSKTYCRKEGLLPFKSMVADCLYGHSPTFLDAVDACVGRTALVAIPSETRCWLQHPRTADKPYR